MAMQILSQFMVVQRVLASLLSLKTENQKEEITAVNQVQQQKAALENRLAMVLEENAALRFDNEELLNMELKKSLHSCIAEISAPITGDI